MFTPTRAVKLPNERIALCDDDDYTEIFGVVVSLSSIINSDFEGFLDMLSEEATGSESMQDISYSLIGVLDGDLVFKVTGVITDIDTEPV
jgi:hypothetical protein